MHSDIQTSPTWATSETSNQPPTPTSLLSPFLALASRLPEKVRDLKTRIADCGLKPSALLGRFDPDTSSIPLVGCYVLECVKKHFYLL